MLKRSFRFPPAGFSCRRLFTQSRTREPGGGQAANSAEERGAVGGKVFGFPAGGFLDWQSLRGGSRVRSPHPVAPYGRICSMKFCEVDLWDSRSTGIWQIRLNGLVHETLTVIAYELDKPCGVLFPADDNLPGTGGEGGERRGGLGCLL